MSLPTLACLDGCESISMKLRVSPVVTEEVPVESTSGKKKPQNLQPLEKKSSCDVHRQCFSALMMVVSTETASHH